MDSQWREHGTGSPAGSETAPSFEGAGDAACSEIDGIRRVRCTPLSKLLHLFMGTPLPFVPISLAVAVLFPVEASAGQSVQLIPWNAWLLNAEPASGLVVL